MQTNRAKVQGASRRALALTFISQARSTLRARWAAVTGRFRQTTPRERLLLAALGVGLLVYAPVMALDARDQAESAYVEALTTREAAERDRQRALSARNTSAREMALQDMSRWGFEGVNAETLRVRLEQDVQAAASDAGMTSVSIVPTDATTQTGPIVWIPIQVQADLTWSPTLRFLDDVSTWPEGFRVTRFSFERPPPPAFEGAPPATAGRVRLELEFPTRGLMAQDERS